MKRRDVSLLILGAIVGFLMAVTFGTGFRTFMKEASQMHVVTCKGCGTGLVCNLLDQYTCGYCPLWKRHLAYMGTTTCFKGCKCPWWEGAIKKSLMGEEPSGSSRVSIPIVGDLAPMMPPHGKPLPCVCRNKGN